MTRLQEMTIDRLALAHGRVAVREGFTDGHIDVTAPQGSCWRIGEDGSPHATHPNFSINWN